MKNAGRSEKLPRVRDDAGRAPLEVLVSKLEKTLRRVVRAYEDAQRLRSAMSIMGLPHERFYHEARHAWRRRQLLEMRVAQERAALEDLRDDARGQYDYVQSLNAKYAGRKENMIGRPRKDGAGAPRGAVISHRDKSRDAMRRQRERDARRFADAVPLPPPTEMTMLEALAVYDAEVKWRVERRHTLAEERAVTRGRQDLAAIACELLRLEDELEALGAPVEKRLAGRAVQRRGRPRRSD